MKEDELYMTRCLQLANLGKGHVSPNPMVGAVLVFKDRIIGEGYHEQYGLAHAEVNCINSVKEKDQALISQSTLYVSLEPCAHFGKTPPCSDLIISHKIPKVMIGCRDPFKEVNGRGIEKLVQAGIEVQTGILEADCQWINRRFFTFHNQSRSYIILKWAQTADHKIASNTGERLLISNEFVNRRVHQWRSEESAILIGTNTALMDNPKLNNRLWTGNSPVRLIIDMHLRLPATLLIFNQQQKTVIFNALKHENIGNNQYYQVKDKENVIEQITKACYQLAIQSILVEGGAGVLQSLINENIWDEAIIITNDHLRIGEGLLAPDLKQSVFINKEKIRDNTIQYFTHE